MTASSAERVPRHTGAEVRWRIQSEAAESARRRATHPYDVGSRLHELGAEWDVERSLEANAATPSLIRAALGAAVDKRSFAAPVAVTAFLLRHAMQGWCPPLPTLRRLSFHTRRQIETERCAFKVLRGHCDGVGSAGADEAHPARQALRPKPRETNGTTEEV